MWITLPVSYFHFRLFLSWRRWGEGQMLLFRYLWRVMHFKMESGKWEGHDFFSQNISQILKPTRLPPIKNVSSLSLVKDTIDHPICTHNISSCEIIRAWKKCRPERDSNPWPAGNWSRCECVIYNNLNFRLPRDQVVHFETATNLLCLLA